MSRKVQPARWLAIAIVCLLTAAMVGCPPAEVPPPVQPPVEEPAEPLEPAEPVEPEWPVEPEEPIGPELPIEPMEPELPIEPMEPEEPAEPLIPEEPMEPEEPAEPLIPEAPMEPEEPAEPVIPEEPMEPEEPAEPVLPEAPMEPEEPAEPLIPEEPAEPTEPMEPEEPAVEEPIEEPAEEPELATDPQGPLSKAELLIELPEKYNTPDALCLMPNGDVIVTVPNVNDRESPPAILRIKPDNTYEEFYTLPAHPVTGETYPFGVATDGKDLFVADLQWFANPEEPGHNARVMWIPMEDGKPGEAKSIIEGLVTANAVLIRDGYIYVSDTIMKPGTQPLVSGVFRFSLEEAKKETIRVTQPLEDDPHCIGTILTHHPDIPFGADGLAMDKDGNLYVGNYADGIVHKIEFEDDGTPKAPTEFAKAPFMKSCDGLFYDAKRDVIIVADMMANAIQIVFMDGTVRTLAQDAASDGSGGRLSSPSEAIVRGDEVIACNFDMVLPGGVNQEFGPPHTISVIKLPESLRD